MPECYFLCQEWILFPFRQILKEGERIWSSSHSHNSWELERKKERQQEREKMMIRETYINLRLSGNVTGRKERERRTVIDRTQNSVEDEGSFCGVQGKGEGKNFGEESWGRGNAFFSFSLPSSDRDDLVGPFRQRSLLLRYIWRWRQSVDIQKDGREMEKKGERNREWKNKGREKRKEKKKREKRWVTRNFLQQKKWKEDFRRVVKAA